MNTRLSLFAIFAISFCVATTCSAQISLNLGASSETTPSIAQHISHENDPVAYSNMMVKTGGFIQSPVRGPVVVFLNLQKRISAATLQGTSDRIQTIMRLPCVFTSKAAIDPIAAAVKALTDTNVAAVVVICDAANQPTLLVAPESRWTLVNVAALGGIDMPTEKLSEHVQKEMWRAFGYVMGAANSSFEHSLLSPVFLPADLDAIAAKSLSPDVFNKILKQAHKQGMNPINMSTYRNAVEEGWAPAPTNEYQRAIWHELKNAPSK